MRGRFGTMGRPAALASLVFFMGACGSSATSGGQGKTTPTPSTGASAIAGAWSGTWQSTNQAGSGTFTLTWTQQGSDLSGTITVTKTPCVANGTLTGKVSGNQIEFGAVQGTYRIDYRGSVSGNSMSGTYASPTCGNAKGNWSATKS